jgi:adenylate cyclase
MKDIGSIVAWLDDGALDAPGPRPLMEEVCSRLTGAGIPLERAAIFVAMLHPDISGLSSVWRRGQPVELSETPHDFTEAFITHPIVGALRTGNPLRRRLDDNATVRDISILGKLRSEGFTDYLATPLRFTNGEVHIASWATRQPSGFADEDLEALAAVARPLARLTEIRSLRRTEATLLETYLGRQAAARVLSGHIRRGDTESIHAAIWLSDLRGFTSLAERLPPQDLTALLNRFVHTSCEIVPMESNSRERIKGAQRPLDHTAPERQCDRVIAP